MCSVIFYTETKNISSASLNNVIMVSLKNILFERIAKEYVQNINNRHTHVKIDIKK